MKLALAGACLAAASIFAAPALAGTAVATLEQPVAKTKFIADGTVWVCDGTSCVAAVTPDDWTPSGGVECKDLAKQVGRVATFKNDYHAALEPVALAKCNVVAKSGPVTAQR